MKSLSHLALATAVLALMNAPATASDDNAENRIVYFAVGAGPSWPTLELDRYQVNTASGRAGSAVGGSIGLQTPWLRWDVADLGYATSQTVSMGIHTTTSLISLGTGFRVGPFELELPVYPYLSFGLAGGRLATNGPAQFSDFSDWGFEWNAGGGIEVRLWKSLRMGLRYRYRSISIDFVSNYTLPPPAPLTGATSAGLTLHSVGIEILL